MKVFDHIGLKTIEKPLIPKDKCIIGIDPSSRHYAFSIMSNKGQEVTLHACGKINFPKGCGITQRCQIIQATFPGLIEVYHPQIMLIEKTIMIQNPQTTILLAYVNGHILGEAVREGLLVDDIDPKIWKTFLGYKNVSKKEKDQWIVEMGVTEARKKASFERKNRTAIIVSGKFEGLTITDTDILDSVGIALYGIHTIGV